VGIPQPPPLSETVDLTKEVDAGAARGLAEAECWERERGYLARLPGVTRAATGAGGAQLPERIRLRLVLSFSSRREALKMDARHGLRRGIQRGGALAAAAVLASAGIALASNAVKGAPYSGHYTVNASDTISFTVSASGKKVTDLDATTPFKCSGGCGGVESVIGGTAYITKKGTFKYTQKLTEPGGTTSFGTVTVTGTFLKGDKAKGKVTSHFNEGNAGETVSWSATALLG
jgi:hypothetical protein